MYRLYLGWATVVFLIIFLKGGLSDDNITRLILFGILGFSLILFRYLRPRHSQKFFITSGVVLASLGEGAYMFSRPFTPSLLVDLHHFQFDIFLRNYAIDLCLTVPAYILIFWVIWKLIHIYSYTTWEYIFLFALGQALGDGNTFFLLNPGMVLFLPYVMINYHAMNVAPYLAIKKHLTETKKRNTHWKYVITPLVLVLTYFVGGTYGQVVAKWWGVL